MPVAICGDCGWEKQWRNQRGVRLADLACPQGHVGVLNRATWDSALEKYVIVGHSSPNKGKHYLTCADCGRRRLELRTRSFPFPLTMPYSRKQIPTSTPICNYHEISRECGIYGCLECVR